MKLYRVVTGRFWRWFNRFDFYVDYSGITALLPCVELRVTRSSVYKNVVMVGVGIIFWKKGVYIEYTRKRLFSSILKKK